MLRGAVLCAYDDVVCPLVVGLDRAAAANRPGQELAHQRQPSALVLTKRPQRARGKCRLWTTPPVDKTCL